jgi:uncharacterized protein
VIEESKISAAARALVDASPPGTHVILFGSHARGDAREGSDLDFLVVQPVPIDRIREAARLDRVLNTLGVFADVIVLDRDTFEHWKDTPNTVIFEAAREGRIIA